MVDAAHATHVAQTAYAVEYLRFIVLAPLLGAVLNIAFGRRLPRAVVGTIACGAVLLAFVTSLRAFSAMPADGYLLDHAYQWFSAGGLNINLALVSDRLSALMCLIVTGVGFLIHVYSLGYMSHDPSLARYFAYLNLFSAAMLVLVLGENLVVMFVGWEGVGLCSYLLIGFWYEDPAKAAAGMKAFIVNRIGDAGFLLGTFALFWAMSDQGHASLSFADINAAAPALGTATATAAALLLFIGATGKSAQIPLYVWLPDAMAGPTPVSALIHAATMVTAGIYMVARLNGLYLEAPAVMKFIATIGAMTALFAATIAITQNDIKKVLAYSTVSQLGYMFLALGVGAFGAAIFHVMTHAFFKACLFLGAGSVIHAMSGEQDIRRMGGLRYIMPVTFATFFISTLAIAGVPGLAGFFSKDEILASVFAEGRLGLWAIGLLTAGMTAFYMMRLFVLTFMGEFRGEAHSYEHVHESPGSMAMPLVVLAFLAAVGGYLGVPHVLGGSNQIGQYLAPVVGLHELHLGGLVEFGLMASSIAIAGLGIWLALGIYMTSPGADENLSQMNSGVYRAAAGGYYVDNFYNLIFVKGAIRAGTVLWKRVDEAVIDRIANGTGTLVQELSARTRRWSTGNVSHYALTFLIGLLVLAAVLALKGLG